MEMEALRKLGELVGHHRVDQVAYLVPDLEMAIADWNAVLGARKWHSWRYSPRTLPRMGFRGEPGRFEMRIALSAQAPQVELIQPVSGPSIYHEWIDRRGYGPHHIGRFVGNIETTVEELRALGAEPVQWGAGYGVNGDGGFAYYEFGPDGETVVELIEPPVRRQPADVL
jgi:methylmalonyl-CoA/ethylmalonyl-CoA epimerase